MLARLCAFGWAPLNQWWQAASWSRWWRLVWTLPTCLATSSGRAVATPCDCTFLEASAWPKWKHLSGSITSLPHGCLPPTGELSRAMCCAPSRAPWSVVTSPPFSCLRFHDVLQEWVEQNRTECVSLLCSSLQVEAFAFDVGVYCS